MTELCAKLSRGDETAQLVCEKLRYEGLPLNSLQGPTDIYQSSVDLAVDEFRRNFFSFKQNSGATINSPWADFLTELRVPLPFIFIRGEMNDHARVRVESLAVSHEKISDGNTARLFFEKEWGVSFDGVVDNTGDPSGSLGLAVLNGPADEGRANCLDTVSLLYGVSLLASFPLTVFDEYSYRGEDRDHILALTGGEMIDPNGEARHQMPTQAKPLTGELDLISYALNNESLLRRCEGDIVCQKDSLLQGYKISPDNFRITHQLAYLYSRPPFKNNFLRDKFLRASLKSNPDYPLAKINALILGIE